MRVCFVSPNAYDLIVRAPKPRHCGGAERQVELLARSLVQRGHSVSVIVWDWGQGDEEEIEGIRVIKTCRRDRGVPGLRFFHPRWTSLNRALSKADAELYFQNLAGYPTGQVGLWCRRHGRRFVYSVVSDPDTDPKLPLLRTMRERILYRYGLRIADRIFAQTKTQQGRLQQGFGYASVLSPMLGPSPVDVNGTLAQTKRTRDHAILWVGRIVPEKRLEWLLEVARLMPALRFDVVGPLGSNSRYTSAVLQRAETLKNVRLKGRVSQEHLTEFYRNAQCLCCTSDVEGFPNTFLEAWSHGLPIVTSFDPDNIIAEHKLGSVASDLDGLMRGLREFTTSPTRWREASENAQRYYADHHAIDKVVDVVEAAVRDVLNPKRKGRASSRPEESLDFLQSVS